VAGLGAEGRFNREMAAMMFLNERTVAVHVANIHSKLGFNSRSQIAPWATANSLTSMAETH
jgi:DNA-binding CsgD family transcriptional regulator